MKCLLLTKADIGPDPPPCNILEKPRPSGASGSLSALRRLTSGHWLGRLTCGIRFYLRRRLGIGVLRYAVVYEVTPLQEVDSRILLGRLSLARSLNLCRYLLLAASSFG